MKTKIFEKEKIVQIKLITKDGVIYPTDLQNLTYEEAVIQLNLLSQKTGFEDCEPDWQGEDVVCLNDTNGDFSLYEIVY